MNVYIPNKIELESIIRDAVKETLEQALPTLVKESTTKQYLTREEVKELTGFNDRRLQYLRDTDKIKYSQDGRKILYLRESLSEYIDSYSNETSGGQS